LCPEIGTEVFSMRILCILLLLSTTVGLSQTTPLSQREACAKFSDAVVSIDAGGQSRGSGFIVSEDGYILTANHVVRNEQGAFYSFITVGFSDGRIETATPAVPLSLDNIGQDFALLKINTTIKLPFLQLGSISEVEIGGDATIIGFPFSAISANQTPMTQKFCLSAFFAASESITIPVNGTLRQTRPGGVPSTTPINKAVKVDVVYFQGPSIKGISGSPIISRESGHVVGIVNTRLTGIGPSLMELKNETAHGLGGNATISGLAPGQAINQILVVMDEQLANGLGSAIGIDDPKEALKQIQRHKR
jgi:S1-C subfamily serine protease